MRKWNAPERCERGGCARGSKLDRYRGEKRFICEFEMPSRLLAEALARFLRRRKADSNGHPTAGFIGARE